MKLAQRLKKNYNHARNKLYQIAQKSVLGWYSYKFKAIALFSTRKAAEAVFDLLCTPYTKRKTYQPTPVFKEAEKLSFSIEKFTINGFRWKAGDNNNGKKILICHGFDSLSYRFENYVTRFRKLGFEVLAFDAPAHGVSSGKTVNASQYSNMILKANELYGPITRIMAHSFGGIAVALALEKLEDNENMRLVLIAPATETTTMINTFFTYINTGEKVKNELHKLIEEIGGNPTEWFSIARVMQQIKTPTLWVHDKNDTITPYKDMEHLLEKNLPHVEFEITEGLGHSDIYKDKRIIDHIVNFLSKPGKVAAKTETV